MKYSIVIPTYNHCNDLLKPCVEAIFKYTTMSEIELIISANGCIDNTKWYLNSLKYQFDSLGFSDNLKVVWSDTPTGYSKATNVGIRVATTDKIILLNNDAFLLGQVKDTWLRMLDEPFERNSNCGISAPLVSFSDPAGHNFAIFFCVMIDRKVFDKIGLLNEIYGKGGGEDTEYCIEAVRAGFDLESCDIQTWNEEIMLHTGLFPIYHRGEATVHDKSLVPDWDDVFLQNSLTLAKKYNPTWYINRIKELGIIDVKKRLEWLKDDKDEENMFEEVIQANQYAITSLNIEGKFVIDVGANIGTFSIFAAELGAKEVHAIEPISTTYNKLIENIRFSGHEDKIFVYKKLVSDKSGDKIKISINDRHGSNSMYNVEDKFEEIETITLSNILSNIEDDDIFLKLDCEGAEFDILLNATDEEMKRISVVVVEIHTGLHPLYNDYKVIHEKLKAWGFKSEFQHQLGCWDGIDSNGNYINYRNLLFRLEKWSK